MIGDRKRKLLGETEATGLRKQKPCSGGNAIVLGTASQAPTTAGCSQAAGSTDRLEGFRQSFLLSSEVIWERIEWEHAQQSLLLALPAPGDKGRRKSQSSAGTQAPLNPFSTWSPLGRKDVPCCWPEGGTRAVRLV